MFFVLGHVNRTSTNTELTCDFEKDFWNQRDLRDLRRRGNRVWPLRVNCVIIYILPF